MVDWQFPLDGAPRARIKDVQAVEANLGVKFPPDYLEVAIAHQGASPDPYVVPLPDGTTTTFETLLHFDPVRAPHTNLTALLYMLEDRLHVGIIPFATSGSDLWCFDFRQDPANPTIVLAVRDNDFDPIPVKDTFTALTESFEEA